ASCRSSGGRAEEVRIRPQYERDKPRRSSNTAERVGGGGPRDSANVDWSRRPDSGRRIFGLAVSALLVALCLPAEAPQPGKGARIGILDPSTAYGSAILWEAFRQQLHKLAWVEGQNITIDYCFAEQKDERLRDLAIELVGRKVDLIVVPDTPSTLAATKASI